MGPGRTKPCPPPTKTLSPQTWILMDFKNYSPNVHDLAHSFKGNIVTLTGQPTKQQAQISALSLVILHKPNCNNKYSILPFHMFEYLMEIEKVKISIACKFAIHNYTFVHVFLSRQHLLLITCHCLRPSSYTYVSSSLNQH